MSRSRLRTAPHRLQQAPERLGVAPSVTGSGRFRHLYRTRRWQKLRWEVLVAGRFKCVMCGLISDRGMVCDHVNGHPSTETEEQFWEGPFQVLCRDCHEGDKARADAKVRKE